MGNPRIVVVGSANTDMCVFVDRLPAVGETVIGGQFVRTSGGKGANQAVAAARLGASVTLVARIGADAFGREAVAAFEKEGINTDYITVDDEQPSGVALILIDSKGENLIAVAGGANTKLSAENVRRASGVISSADCVLMQLEVPMEAVVEAARIARAGGVPVLLNPAPAPRAPLPGGLISACRALTPNRRELKGLAPGAPGVEQAAAKLLESGPDCVVVTLGAEGVLVCGREGVKKIPAFSVEAVDTVGAGDCFSAALAVALAEGRNAEEAARFACAAAAISVTRPGAQTSLPVRREVEQFLVCAKSAEVQRK